MIFSLILSPSLLAQQTTDTGWKVINKDVYKKDTSGKVVIGNTEIKEKLNVAGDVRIDGLKGVGNRRVYVDKDGKLRADRSEMGPGGPKEHPILELCLAIEGVWKDLGNRHLQLCPLSFDDLSVPILNLSHVSNSTDPNLMLRLNNASYGSYDPSVSNEPSLQFDNGIQDPFAEAWIMGAKVEGTKFLRIGRISTGNYQEFFRITQDGKIGIGTDDPHRKLDVYGHIGLIDHLVFNSTSTAGVINWPESRSLWFRTNSNAGDINSYTTRMIITGDGKVGIGMDNPNYRLTIGNGANGSGGVTNEWHDNSTLGIPIGDEAAGGVKFYDAQDENNQYAEIKYESGSNLLKLLNKGLGLSIGSNGKVGIGTSSPSKALQIKTYHLVSGGGGTPLSHYGVRLEDYSLSNTNFSTISSSIWDIEPIAGDNKPLHFKIFDGAQKTVMTMNKNLFVGIGTEDPQSPLHIFRNSPATGQNELLKLSNHWISGSQNEPTIIFDNDGLGGTQPSVRWKVGARVAGTHFFRINFETSLSGSVVDKELFRISENGDVRMCHVKANEFTVENVTGCDFVFGVDYRLPSLSEVEEFIQKNEHLEGIPSAKEMQENGVEVGDLQMKLLQKVEELYLYTIEQDKMINKLKNEMDVLKILFEKE